MHGNWPSHPQTRGKEKMAKRLSETGNSQLVLQDGKAKQNKPTGANRFDINWLRERDEEQTQGVYPT